MKNFLLLAAFSILSFIATAQTKSTVLKPDTVMVEETASFTGGMPEMYKFLGKNLKYPQKSRDEKVEGQVFVQFTIDEKGKITNPKVLRGVNTELDNEALRVVKMMPNWKPAKANGKPIVEEMTLPISFKIRPAEEKK